MTTFERAQVSTLCKRLSEPSRTLITLFGPRQTGKTTIARQALRRMARTARLDSRYLSVDDPEPGDPLSLSDTAAASAPLPGERDIRWLVRQWQTARRAAMRQPQGHVLVLDEVQKIPRWSEAVKGLRDADRARDLPLHVVVLGSAPLLMQSGLSESLAGRFETIRVTHWSFPEMAEAFGFDLPRYLYFGGYPGPALLVDDPDPGRWRDQILGAFVEPNIERDILSMTRVDKPALLKQLFALGAEYSGQILSYNKMLGQLQGAGNTTTLARYLELLSRAGLVAGLPRHAGSAVTRYGSSPKLNVLNTALMTAGSGYSFAEARADRTFWGRIVESAVGAHLLNTADSDTRIRYWRDASLEVDFVLERGPRLVAIEVKSGPRRGRLRGMEAFRKRFPRSRSLLVGEEGVPLNEFLAAPTRYWIENA